MNDNVVLVARCTAVMRLLLWQYSYLSLTKLELVMMAILTRKPEEKQRKYDYVKSLLSETFTRALSIPDSIVAINETVRLLTDLGYIAVNGDEIQITRDMPQGNLPICADIEKAWGLSLKVLSEYPTSDFILEVSMYG